jgi:hypothetical protein
MSYFGTLVTHESTKRANTIISVVRDARGVCSVQTNMGGIVTYKREYQSENAAREAFEDKVETEYANV